MKHDYTQLDAAILARIHVLAAANVAVFYRIDSGEVRRAAEVFATPQKDAWRFVDSRLQALRKAGRIGFSGAGWYLVTFAG